MNLPYQSIGSLGFVFNISNCDIWYLYGFDENVTQDTKKFWGSNSGTPIYLPDSEGLLDGQSNILQTACPETGKSTPYFIKTNETETINEYLYKTVKDLNDERIDFKDRASEINNLHLLPDGAFRIKEASSKLLSYNVQVNDIRYYQYHRNNGITKFGISDPNSNVTAVFMSPVEG